MTTSPLTAAILGWDDDTGGKNNPRYGPSRRKQAMAQSFYNTASDISPAASPFAGLARALTAIPGGVLDYVGTQEAEGITQGYNKERDALLAEAEGPETWQQKPVSSLTGTMPPQTQQPVPPQRDITGGGAPVASRADLDPIVTEAAARHGLPVELAKALFQQESSYGTNPKAKGNIGQIIGTTAAEPGFGMEPISVADMADPAKNVDFSLRYLKARGDAAGVTDWKDPKQWALALKAYNGGGDPDYVEHVAKYLPSGTAVRTGGTDYAGPGVPPAQDGATAPAPGQQPQADSSAAADEQMGLKLIAQAHKMLKMDTNNPHYPQMKLIAQMKIEQGKLMIDRSHRTQTRDDRVADRDEDRRNRVADRQAAADLADKNRTPQTITMLDPDGKGSVGIYERTPTGVGKRLGDAPKQPGDESALPLGKSPAALAGGVLDMIAPLVLNGTATPEQVELFRRAGDQYTAGDYDPATGKTSQGRPFTPRMQEAFDKLNATTAAPAPGTPATVPPAVPPAVPGAAPTPQAPAVPAPATAAPLTVNPTARTPERTTTPTGSIRTSQAPSTTTQAQEDYRKAENESGKVLDAVDAFMTELKAQGGTGFDSYTNNPREPKAIKLNSYHDRIQEALRGEAFMNTGVLSPPEAKALIEKLLDPRSLRGWAAKTDSFQALADVLRSTIANGLARKRAAAGLEPSPTLNAETKGTSAPREVKTPADAEALPPGTRYRTPDGRTFTR